MLKTLDVILVAALLSAAAWTFGMKHEAENLEAEVRLMDRKIAQERETIQLLSADWSLLNQPYRLQRLAEAFEGTLKLKPINPEQMAAANELPAPPAPKAEDDMQKIASIAKDRAR